MTQGRKVGIYRAGGLWILDTRDDLGVFDPGAEIEVTIEGVRGEEDDATLIHSTLGGRVSEDGEHVHVERGWDFDYMGTPGTLGFSNLNVVGWLLKPKTPVNQS